MPHNESHAVANIHDLCDTGAASALEITVMIGVNKNIKKKILTKISFEVTTRFDLPLISMPQL